MKNKNLENITLISSEEEINNFIEHNERTVEILEAMQPHLKRHFPNSALSLEVSNNIKWTSETKLLLNVHVSQEMFFNGMLNHFNEIYAEIEPLLNDVLCPVVLFPELENKKYDKLGKYSAINLIARTAYFNNDFDENYQREMTLREIPKEQQIKEIIEYCKTHENPNISDIVFDLQLDLFEVDTIIDELEDKGMKLNINY